MDFKADMNQLHYISRHLLATDGVCTQERYDKCFSLCPPMIPGPPPPPESLKDYRRTWCIGHTKPWVCENTNSGPSINGTNPRLKQVDREPVGPSKAAVISLSVILPIIFIALIVAAVLLYIKRKKSALKKKTDNTYNLGYLSKPPAPTWTDNDGTEVAVEDGSEIFYQVDRTALSAGLNGVGGNTRSVPDVVHSSNATLRKSSPNNLSVFDLGRSGSATSQIPLLASPEIAAHNRRRAANRTISTGADTAESDLGSPTYTRYGTTSHQPMNRKLSHEPPTTGAALAMGSGYMTYSPNTKSHPSLYSGNEKGETSSTTIRTPKSRQRSFGSADHSKPRPLRKPTGAAGVQRSDSMTLNRAGGRENYKNNWENFDEVTATMRKNKSNPSGRELVLGTDSFIESFNTPEQEEATSVDQLGMPTRNPFLAGFYDYEPDSETQGSASATYDEDINLGGPDDDIDFYGAHSSLNNTRSPDRPPSYDEVIPPRRTPSVSASRMATLDLRERRDRISEYDSEASVEV